MTSGWQGAPNFRRYDRELGFETGDFVEENRGGGYRRTTRRTNIWVNNPFCGPCTAANQGINAFLSRREHAAQHTAVQAVRVSYGYLALEFDRRIVVS